MGLTIAEALRKEGRKQGEVRALQQTLLLQLETRFGSVPEATEKTVNATKNVRQLKRWLVQFAKAETLDDVGISTES